jgi:hypothetical protein
MLAVTPGIYTVTEDDPAPGAILIGLVCNDGTSAVPSTPDVGTRSATVRLEPNETVECTFTNQLLQFSIALTKTVGLSPLTCAATSNIMVPPGGVDVTYCYTVQNTGNITLSAHSLVDTQLGGILNNFAYDLLPGATTFVTATANITETTVNTATWTATHADPPGLASAMASATVLVEPPTAVRLSGLGVAASRTILPWAGPLAIVALAGGLSLVFSRWYRRRRWR